MNPNHGRRPSGASTRTLAIATAALVGSALGLTGCSNDTGKGDGADAPVELTYWTWMTNIEDVVDIWNSENPDIQVTVDRLAEGDDLVTRIVTAANAGNLPDMMQVEYQSLPILVSNDIVADVTDEVAGLQDAMAGSAWDQVTWGGATYAIPGDIGPLVMYVRADLFEQRGLAVPSTWDEFATAAQQIHEADPSAFVSSFDATYPGWFAGLAQQAGAEWWAADDDAWAVDIDDAPTEKVATYWGDLLQRGLLSTSPTYSAEWNAGIAGGSILSWIAPVWGAGVIEGIAPDSAGSWTAVPLPQWEAGEAVTGYWGGSSAAISKTSEHAAEAAEFLSWLYTSAEGTQALVDISGLYPAAVVGQEYTTGTSTPMILGDQSDFWELAANASANARGFLWSPNVNYTFSQMQDAFGTAIEQGTPLVDTLGDIETASRKDLADQGYPVAD